MTGYTLVVNKNQIRGKSGRFGESIKGVREEFLRLAAQQLVKTSPVDTGTYITSFEFNEGVVQGPVTSSKGKPRKQPRDPFESKAVDKLLSEISTLSENSTNVVLSNTSVHAPLVEIKYAVFAQLRNTASYLAQQAKRNGK